MGLIIVERTFEHPPTNADLDAAAERERKRKEIHSITWKRSVMSRDRRRGICEYEAPDAETVRRVQLEAGIPFDRIWAAELHE
ncbi:MAG: DUF4242 domain-containing protein [Rhodopila sp.]